VKYKELLIKYVAAVRIVLYKYGLQVFLKSFSFSETLICRILFTSH